MQDDTRYVILSVKHSELVLGNLPWSSWNSDTGHSCLNKTINEHSNSVANDFYNKKWLL